MARETVDNQSEEILGLFIVLLAEEPEVRTACLIVVVVFGPLRDLFTYALYENATGLAAHGGSPILDIKSTENTREAGFVKVTLMISERGVAEVDTVRVDCATLRLKLKQHLVKDALRLPRKHHPCLQHC